MSVANLTVRSLSVVRCGHIGLLPAVRIAEQDHPARACDVEARRIDGCRTLWPSTVSLEAGLRHVDAARAA